MRYDEEWKKKVSEGVKRGMKNMPQEKKDRLAELTRQRNLKRRYKKKTFDELKSWHSIKKFVIAEMNETCEKCGWNKRNPFHDKILLQVNHKDGDRSNNKRDNLEVLCPNCHSLTEYFMFYGRKHSEETKAKISEAAKKQFS